MKQIIIPCIFYLYIHSKIYQKTRGNPIKLKEAKQYLFQWKIPEKIRPLIIREMELLELVEQKGGRLYLNYPKIDIEDCNNYYEVLGFYN